jgi:hypothetical protein
MVALAPHLSNVVYRNRRLYVELDRAVFFHNLGHANRTR